MSEGGWYLDAEAHPVEATDEETYDEAWGPRDPHVVDGRLVEDDEGVRPDTTPEAVATVAAGDTAWLSAEEAAVHVVDETDMVLEDFVGADELPPDPDDR